MLSLPSYSLQWLKCFLDSDSCGSKYTTPELHAAWSQGSQTHPERTIKAHSSGDPGIMSEEWGRGKRHRAHSHRVSRRCPKRAPQVGRTVGRSQGSPRLHGVRRALHGHSREEETWWNRRYRSGAALQM